MKKIPEDKISVGRPKLNIDGEKISKWISYGATVREIADELELPSSFEVDPKTGKKFDAMESETPDEIAATPGD